MLIKRYSSVKIHVIRKPDSIGNNIKHWSVKDFKEIKIGENIKRKKEIRNQTGCMDCSIHPVYVT